MSVNEEQAYQVSSKSLQQYQVSCQFAYVFAPPYLRFWMSIVTNMECRFPAMLVLLLGRKFYRVSSLYLGRFEAYGPISFERSPVSSSTCKDKDALTKSSDSIGSPPSSSSLLITLESLCYCSCPNNEDTTLNKTV
ncbi:hypothetical protein AVEN_267131-1 [Araneus ventricosus]|uniref:Uncharacterized protein n=1 Tax=Araneus ventricosus TaxID=182803 RepID=A0A4Y2GCB3_ARAVE|nr:hypothetical protein AVEN_267131-1 [Araneus ventricosus]